MCTGFKSTVPHTAIYGFYCSPTDSLKALNYQESNRLACGVPPTNAKKEICLIAAGHDPLRFAAPTCVRMRHCISLQLCAVLDKIATGSSNGLYCLTVKIKSVFLLAILLFLFTNKGISRITFHSDFQGQDHL